MDNGVVTDNVIDTTNIHNTGSKLLDNVTFSNKCLCATAYKQ